VALQLQQMHIKARSVLAWQLPIISNDHYNKALVESLDIDVIEQCLRDHTVPVVTGFNAITKNKRCTTLGRGGSDTSAMIIAATIRADRCDIYTDVDGIFTADPRIVNDAVLLQDISFEAMLAFASSGAKVLAARSVELAMRYNIPTRVLSSFTKTNGTLISARTNIMEHRSINGVSSNKNLLRLIINNPRTEFHKICAIFVQNNIHSELMLNMNINYSFIVQLNDYAKLKTIISELEIDFTIDNDIAAISIIGYGIKNDSSFIGSILDILNKRSIAILMIEISEIKVSILINDRYTEDAIRSIHGFLQLS
jgi:aspartate kinase